MNRLIIASIMIVAATGVISCAGSSKQQVAKTSSAAGEKTPTYPLSGLASKQLIVLPVQHLVAGPSGISDREEFMASLDSAIAATLENRGLRGTWTFADEVARLAKRNAAMMPDVYTLSVERLRNSRMSSDQLGEPLASQIRSLVALRDARYVLLPSEIRFETVADSGTVKGSIRAVLKLALIDSRLSRVAWRGEVTDASSNLVAGISSRFADLIIE